MSITKYSAKTDSRWDMSRSLYFMDTGDRIKIKLKNGSIIDSLYIQSSNSLSDNYWISILSNPTGKRTKKIKFEDIEWFIANPTGKPLSELLSAYSMLEEDNQPFGIYPM